MDIEQQKLWEEAREWAVAEILSKYHKELIENQRKHFIRLITESDTYPRPEPIKDSIII